MGDEGIDAGEAAEFRKAAAYVLGLSEAHLAELMDRGLFRRYAAMTKKYRSDAYAAIHETMEAMHEVGAIDKRTLREFDNACLTPAMPMQPERIRALRERERVSQSVFALYLNVSKNLVSDWERGVKKPGGPALRLLTVIEKNGIQAIA